MRIDRELRDLFLEIGGSGAPITYSDHKDEHAIEVQLPFLQVCLEDFKLLPILMGNESPEHAKQLGRILSEVLSEDENVLLIAGSDLSHCYDSKKAARLDKACSEDIAHLDPDALIKDLDSDKYGACGEGPIVAALLAAKRLGAHHAAVLHHCNSGEITQDKTSVADYLSAVIYN